MPHKLVIAPIVQLPFGRGRPYANTGWLSQLAGGWTIAVVAMVQSGFPIAVTQTPNFAQVTTQGIIRGLRKSPCASTGNRRWGPNPGRVDWPLS